MRYAVREIAPNDVGPQLTGGKIDLSAVSPERATTSSVTLGAPAS